MGNFSFHNSLLFYRNWHVDQECGICWRCRIANPLLVAVHSEIGRQKYDGGEDDGAI